MKHLWIILLWVPVLCLAQAPDTLWTRTIGGAGHDVPAAIRPTSDGGFIIAGRTNSIGAGNYDAYVVKLDNLGNVEWERTWGDSLYGEASDVSQTPDGGYVAIGTQRFGPDDWNHRSESQLVRLEPNGVISWIHNWAWYPNGEIHHQIGLRVLAMPDGRIIVTSQKQYGTNGAFGNLFLAGFSSNGDSLWSRGLQMYLFNDGAVWHTYDDLELSPDGNLFLAKRDLYREIHLPHGEIVDTWYSSACKLTPSGGEIWANTIRVPYQVQIAPNDSGCLVGLLPMPGGHHYSTLKVNNVGTSIWSFEVMAPFFDLVAAPEDGVVLLESDSNTTNDLRICSFDNRGMPRWVRTWETPGVTESPISIEPAGQGKYVILASAQSGGAPSDIVVLCTNADHAPEFALELIQPGPPDWGYRLRYTYSSTDTLSVGPLCPGTTTHLSGIAAQHWRTVLDTSQGVTHALFFPLDPGLEYPDQDTFWLNSPVCDGAVEWNIQHHTGEQAGPYNVSDGSAALRNPTIVDTDFGLEVSVESSNEQNLRSVELWRSSGDSLHFVRIQTYSPQGGGSDGVRYSFLDTSITYPSKYWYRWGIVDRYGWRQTYSETSRSVLTRHYFNARIGEMAGQFSAPATDVDRTLRVVLDFSTLYEYNLRQLKILRDEDGNSEFAVAGTIAAAGRSDAPQQYHYVDETVRAGHTYRYRIRTVDSSYVTHDWEEPTVTVPVPPEIVYSYHLAMYPNPFNSEARLQFELARAGTATLKVYNLAGQLVTTLADGYFSAGRYERRFDGTPFSSGIYLVRFSAQGGYETIQKLVLLK